LAGWCIEDKRREDERKPGEFTEVAMLARKCACGLLIAALAAGCGPAAALPAVATPPVVAARLGEPVRTSPTVVVVPTPPPPAECAVTRPQNPAFVPPAPNSPEPPDAAEFWYGSPALWTLLYQNGSWWALPHDEQGYTQKVAFWRQGYNYAAEQQPDLTVTGRRLDGEAPPLVASTATNGFEAHVQSFMLVGVEVPTLGCWEITGRYGGHALSFVVWVTN
jgi:hypothetical protein